MDGIDAEETVVGVGIKVNLTENQWISLRNVIYMREWRKDLIYLK